MTRRVKPHRKVYESPARRERLDASRRRVVEVARRLFGDRGYEATTVAAIAREAGVAVPTVYKNFGSKSAILRALVDTTINVRVPAAFGRVFAAGDPEARLRALAHMCVSLAGQAADVIAIVVAATGADPAISRFIDEQEDGRRANAERLARWLSSSDSLRQDCTVEEARDVLWALAGPQTYRLLATLPGWGDEHFERWLGDALVRLLVRESSSGVRPRSRGATRHLRQLDAR